MRRDIKDLLHDAAYQPEANLDVPDVRRRARRARRSRHLWAGAAALILTALAVSTTGAVVQLRQSRVDFADRQPIAGVEATVRPTDADDAAHEAKKRAVRRQCRNGPYAVILRPASGPPGTLVRFSGHCFVGGFADEKGLMGGRGMLLIRDTPDCELLAGAQPSKLKIDDGRGRGYFTVPAEGDCFQGPRKQQVIPGRYRVALRYHAVPLNATFTVTPRVPRKAVCAPDQVGINRLESEGVMQQTALFLGVHLIGDKGCRIDTTATVTVLTNNGAVLDARGNPAQHRLVGVLRPLARRISFWGWGSNHCGREPLQVRVQVSGYGERTDPLETLSGGGSSCGTRFRLSEPSG